MWKLIGQKSNRHLQFKSQIFFLNNSTQCTIEQKIQKFSQEAQVMPKSESWMFSWFIVKHVLAWLHVSFSSNVSFCLPISGVPWWISLFNNRYSIYITAIHKKRPQTILNDHHKKALHNLLMITCVKLTGIWSTNSVNSWDFWKTFPGPLS